MVADQLGHARPSMTQDVYAIGRRAGGSEAADALEAALLVALGEPNPRSGAQG